MKTIEEKAKAYDEALKWMREFYPGLHGATKEDAERYFSELRESEDERIRRTLVEYFGPEVQLDFIRGVPIQKIRDWLEKQEQKPAWSKEDEKMRYFVTEAVLTRYSDRELAKFLDPKIINEKKQLKQKLFDWLRDLRPSWKPSEEQMEVLKEAVAYFGDSWISQKQKISESLYNDLLKLKSL